MSSSPPINSSIPKSGHEPLSVKRQPQPKQNARLRFTFVTDGVESAIAQAKKAAGEKNVTIVGGPTIARHCLSLGLIDELQLGIVPVP